MKSDFKPGREGVVFKNGKLYEFTDRHVLVLSAWPDPRCWFKRRSHGWKASRKWADALMDRVFPKPPGLFDLDYGVPCRDGDQLLMAGITEDPKELWWQREQLKRRAALDAYRATFPFDARELLQACLHRRWHLANLMARCPGAVDLADNNLALACALASSWVFRKPAVTQPMRAARRLVNRKQRVIMEWLGFPDTESARRIMSCVHGQGLHVGLLLKLRNLLHDPEKSRYLAHLTGIGSQIICLLADKNAFPYLTPSLLKELAWQDPWNETSFYFYNNMLKDTLKMAEERVWGNCPSKFRSVKKLQEVHDEMVDRMNRVRGRRNAEWALHRVSELAPITRFPDPPFNGTPDVLPVMTVDELNQEGRVMAHCVAIYAGEIDEGSVFVYKVMSPVRATLMIRRRDSRWVLDQVMQRRNVPVNPEIATRLYNTVIHSGLYIGRDDATLRCDLPEGQQPPREWGELDPRQLPLMTPEEQALMRQCLAVFGADSIEDERPSPI